MVSQINDVQIGVYDVVTNDFGELLIEMSSLRILNSQFLNKYTIIWQSSHIDWAKNKIMTKRNKLHVG